MVGTLEPVSDQPSGDGNGSLAWAAGAVMVVLAGATGVVVRRRKS